MKKKKKEKKKMGIWQKYVLLLVITVALCFAINGFLYVPMPTLVDESGWLNFFGSLLGAAVAGIVTLWGIEYTIKTTVMNAKPCIRPTRKDYFLYYNEKRGLFVIDKPFSVQMEEKFSKDKVDLTDINELVIGKYVQELAESKQGTKWESILGNLNIKKLCNRIKDMCEYQTYERATEIMYRELDKEYANGVGRVIYDKVFDLLRHNIASSILSQQWKNNPVFYCVYNTGAGNATDVSFEWDFSKNYHLRICKDLGFNEEDFDKMNRSFSLDKIEIAEADVMLNENGNNMVRVQVPGEVILFIKKLYLKSINNGKEEKYEANNALVGEREFAELHIMCKDIYGERHSFNYKVMFRIMPTLQSEFEYIEEKFYLKFENI